MRKVKDLAVVTGTYTKNGVQKNRYKTIGVILENDKGQFMFLDRSFNPAGVPFKEGTDSVLISIFDPKQDDKPSSTPVADESIPF